jgi:hypothetical protein
VRARSEDAVGESAIGPGSPLGTDRPPRVEITLPACGVPSEAAERWAAAMLDTWGSDRVVVTRGHLHLRDATHRRLGSGA